MPHKFIISGGGTGGHIFPAVAIARELQLRFPDCEILFVGAKDRMEMEKIPREGYKIIGLDIAGLKRSLNYKNLGVFYKFIKSYFDAKKIINDFAPDCAIGTGGYASLPLLYAAGNLKIPTVIWEGNGYAGLSNKILAKKASRICTGFPGMESFFPKEKVVFTGNPLRPEMLNLPSKMAAKKHFGLDPQKPVLFITGGSLGARVINESIHKGLPLFEKNGIQLIWQTGQNFLHKAENVPSVLAFQFLNDMDKAYAAADLVISRAGALSISEICACGKASILVPSSNVTDDHQSKNARVMVLHQAAVMIADNVAPSLLVKKAIELIQEPGVLHRMETHAMDLAKPEATKRIVDEIGGLIVDC